MMLCHYILQGRKTAQNEAGKKKNFLRKSVVLGWEKALAFGTLYDKYVERKTPSLDKDTHTFASDATSAPVVLTLRFASGRHPRCGASSFPRKVLRPCRGPEAEIGTDCVIVLGIRQYAGVLFLVIIRFSPAEKSYGVFAREKWHPRKRGAAGRLAPVNAMRNVGRYLCPQKLYVLLSNEGNHRKAWRKLPRCRLTGGIQL